MNNISLSAASFEKSSSLTTPPLSDSSPQKTSGISISHNPAAKPTTTSSFELPHEEASIASVSEASKNEDSQFLAQIGETIQKLAPFFPELTNENKDQIFFLDEEGNVTLGNNEMETFNVADLASEASHEAAKERLIDGFTKFYGKESTDLFYPEEERTQPLTVARAAGLQQQFLQLQQSVVSSCQGDLSKYETQLHSQLEELKQLQTMLAAPPQASAEQRAVIDTLSKYTGLPASILYAGILAGGVLAASASGLALPLVLHSSMAAALSHGSALSAALVSGVSNAATTTAHIAAGAAAHHHASTAVSWGIGAGGGVGAITGAIAAQAMDPNFTHHDPPAFFGGGIIGAWLGMGIGVAGAVYGPALFHTLLSSLGPATTATTTIGAGTVLGAAAGGVAASSQNNPTQDQVIQSMMIGAGAGGIISALSLVFGSAALGHTVATTGGIVRGLRGIVAGSERGPQGAIQEGIRGAALGIATGGGVTLFGGLCSGLAHLIIAGAIDPSLEALRTYGTAAAMTGGGVAVNRYLRQEPFDGDAGQAEYAAQENGQVAELIPDDFNRVPVAEAVPET